MNSEGILEWLMKYGWAVIIILIVAIFFWLQSSGILKFAEPTQLNFECGEYEQECRIEYFYNDMLFSECTYDFDDCTEERIKEKLTERLFSKGNITDIKHDTVDVWVRDEEVLVDNKIGTREKCCYEYFWKYVICEPSGSCTNNLSFAYCNGMPDTCNERYGIEPWDCITPSENVSSVGGGACDYIGFECVEWESNCSEFYLVVEIEHENGINETKDLSITCEGFPCTLSKLTCHDSVENCNRRYS